MSEPTAANICQYLSIRELSDRCGLSVTQLRRLVHAERIIAFQPAGPGGKLLFRPDAIERGASTDAPGGRAAPKPLSGRRPGWMQR